VNTVVTTIVTPCVATRFNINTVSQNLVRLDNRHELVVASTWLVRMRLQCGSVKRRARLFRTRHALHPEHSARGRDVHGVQTGQWRACARAYKRQKREEQDARAHTGTANYEFHHLQVLFSPNEVRVQKGRRDDLAKRANSLS
jgi:hypothetical protein